MDTECVRPLRMMSMEHDVMLGRMGPNPAFEHSVPNAIMASKPRQIFWTLVIAMMIEACRDKSIEVMRQKGPERLTGPILLKQAADFYLSSSEKEIRSRAQPVIDLLPESVRATLMLGKLEILPPAIWYPLDWTNPFHRLMRKELEKQRLVLSPHAVRGLFREAFFVSYWSHSWG